MTNKIGRTMTDCSAQCAHASTPASDCRCPCRGRRHGLYRRQPVLLALREWARTRPQRKGSSRPG